MRLRSLWIVSAARNVLCSSRLARVSIAADMIVREVAYMSRSISFLLRRGPDSSGSLRSLHKLSSRAERVELQAKAKAPTLQLVRYVCSGERL
jgi:hypothetical protein